MVLTQVTEDIIGVPVTVEVTCAHGEPHPMHLLQLRYFLADQIFPLHVLK